MLISINNSETRLPFTFFPVKANLESKAGRFSIVILLYYSFKFMELKLLVCKL
ncbi:hypothetical protein GILI108418_14780 [Gillisia limnaea]|uniref:Uncharacterized protein n=1 Tax=Gillisia limnaea (strain DSM 15749 / LMG 21470 / R-8282) TaxID=865937 RepID=H2BS58_GILLR|nr:hypothetical protein Gilli_2974 [Gillisia limnaea DSM 15749]